MQLFFFFRTFIKVCQFCHRNYMHYLLLLFTLQLCPPLFVSHSSECITSPPLLHTSYATMLEFLNKTCRLSCSVCYSQSADFLQESASFFFSLPFQYCTKDSETAGNSIDPKLEDNVFLSNYS